MGLDILRIRAFCFDVDGTLRDTDDQMVEHLLKIADFIKWIFPNHNPQPYVRRFIMALENPGNLLLQVPDRLGLDGEISRFGDRLSRLGWIKTPKSHPLIEGVMDTLSELQSQFQLSIVSNRGNHMTESFVDYCGLRHFFKQIITAQTCQHNKPYPDQILYAATQMDVLPKECVMVGDTPMDMQAGIAAGAQTIGVLSGFGEENELQEAGACIILPSIMEIPGYLRQNLNQTKNH